MRSFLARSPKWLVLGVAGLLGGLLLALFAERWVGEKRAETILVAEDQRPVDLVFVLDISGSMSGELEGVRNSLTEFLGQLEARKIKGRFGLVTFDSDARVTHPLTSDVSKVVEAMKPLFVKGGRAFSGDSSLSGLAVAAGVPFNRDARKVVILITDETTDIPDDEIFSTDDVVAKLKAAKVDEVDVVTLASLTDDYAFLSSAAPGKAFTMDRYGRQSEGLANLFKEVAVAVADSSVLRGTGVPGAKIDVALVRKNFWPDALQAGLWVGLVCFGIAVAVETFQQVLLGGSLRPLPVLRTMAISLGLGFAAGVIAQALYTYALGEVKDYGELPRIASWTFVGAGLGLTITLAMPNLNVIRSVIFGALGGLVAVGGFLLVSMSGADMASRLMGASFLGLFIALAVTIAEAVAREAYLVVHWAKNETTTVNLGSRLVMIGTSRDSTVRLPVKSGYPPEIASFQLKDGKAVLTNHMSRTTHILKNGNKLTLGSVVIEVRIIAGYLTTPRP
jgi:Ca-activated chloride channel family protein